MSSWEINQSLPLSRKISLDDPPEIFFKDIARIACIREYLQESYKNGIILQVQENLLQVLSDTLTMVQHQLHELEKKTEPRQHIGIMWCKF